LEALELTGCCWLQDELYFQCVVGLLKLTSALEQAHGRAKEVAILGEGAGWAAANADGFAAAFLQVFSVDRKEAFMPHVR
jgi:hypothetical protein